MYQKIGKWSIALCVLLAGVGLGGYLYSQSLPPEVPCMDGSWMPSPCNGETYYKCTSGCSFQQQGTRRTKCFQVTSGCCQYIEATGTCLGGPCTNCPLQTTAMEFSEYEQGYCCEPSPFPNNEWCVPCD